MPKAYQSYMVRVRRRGAAPESVRIEVEDLIGGARTQLTGGAASDLAADLAAALGSEPSGSGEPGQTGDTVAAPIDGVATGD